MLYLKYKKERGNDKMIKALQKDGTTKNIKGCEKIAKDGRKIFIHKGVRYYFVSDYNSGVNICLGCSTIKDTLDYYNNYMTELANEYFNKNIFAKIN